LDLIKQDLITFAFLEQAHEARQPSPEEFAKELDMTVEATVKKQSLKKPLVRST